MARMFVHPLVAGVLAILMVAPAGAHASTNFGGVLHGSLRPASPEFSFTGEALFGGQWHGAEAGGQFTCTASGPNEGTAPFGGPFEGTYSCGNTGSRVGRAPASFGGSLKGWTNFVTIVMKGDVQPDGHTFNCEGVLRVEEPSASPVNVLFGVTMACLIQ